MHVCVSGGKKCLFFENFGVLYFLETPVSRFALSPYFRAVLGRLEMVQCKCFSDTNQKDVFKL